MKKGIIIEIIPDRIKDGDIIQLEALKISNNILIDRLDLRLNKESINDDLLKMTSYDKESHTYLNSTSEILDKLRNFSNDYIIYTMSDSYTNNYLKGFNTKSIENLLDTKYSEDLVERLIKKYKIAPSNYIVDILYEAILLK